MGCLIRMKACKRCGGDLSLERDTYGNYFECIQCGAIWSKMDIVPPDNGANHDKAESRQESVTHTK